MSRPFFAISLVVLSLGTNWVWAEDDSIKKNLATAKQAYDLELEKYRKTAGEWFDELSEAARKKGDKKLLDQIKEVRAAFDEKGQLPKTFPLPLKKLAQEARAAMDLAYITAVKEYTKAKKDDMATAVEKETAAFIEATTKTTFFSELTPVRKKIFENWFLTDGTIAGIKYVVAGKESPHGIVLHPPSRGYSEIVYNIDREWGNFHCGVGVAPNPEKNPPKAEVTFLVIGDGKVLWKSKPIKEADKLQECEVNVEKVGSLSLRVLCPGDNYLAWAVWLEPQVSIRR